MVIINQKELAEKFLSASDKKLIMFQKTVLKKGPSFSKHLKQTAIDLADNFTKNHRFCVLVEMPSYWTIWHESAFIKQQV